MRFVNDFIFPTLKAGAVYENKYLLRYIHSTPGYSKTPRVEIAEKEVSPYGNMPPAQTGKGRRDRVRFELTIMALNPRLEIIAPWRIWNLKSEG